MLAEALFFSAVLFTIGVVGVLTRRNAIIVFMCVELMLNAVNLTFVAFAQAYGAAGQVFVFFVMTVAAAEAAVGLAIIIALFRHRQTVNLPEEVLVAEFADGAFGELDPFTSMIWPSDLEEFNKTTQGEFSGVGIQIQSDEDGSLKVVSPLEDSPAYKAGIKAGDLITHINGKNAKGITLNQAVKTITGS